MCLSRVFHYRSPRGAALILGLVVLLLFPLSFPLYCQTLASTASISGSVVDPQDARIPSAKVTLLCPERGITRTFETGSSGTFSFTLVPPAIYSLKVEAPGFQTYSRGGITVEVGLAYNLSVVLLLAGVHQNVEVSAAAPLLTTDNANVGSVVTENQTVELPLNYRNVMSLVFLDSAANNENTNASGTTGQSTADQDVSFLNFAGQFFGTTGFLLDGAWDTAMGWGGVIYVPSVDNVEEFKIQTNSFTAQYGMSTGNVINVVTKTGTSNFHGDVYDFLRNDALDANFYFNNLYGLPKTAFHRNQFGITGGGPLYIPGIYKQRERTFFFAQYEGLRLHNPLTFTGTVPTAAFRTGNMSALLGQQIGTDALGRPILAGQMYHAYTVSSQNQGEE